MEYVKAGIGIIGAMVGGFLFAMFVQGDLKPTYFRKLIRKWRKK